MKERTGMKKVKIILIAIAVILFITGIYTLASTYFGSGNWVKRFDSELDQFFGKGNWEYISTERNKSRMFEVRRRNSIGTTTWKPGSYKNWVIGFENRYGEEELWEITNHTLKINNDKYGFLSPKRYSNKQAMILELMDISHGIAAEEIYKDVIEKVFPGEEASCINVEMSYHGGNPKPKFYNALWKEPWFKANSVTAGDFLACDLHDFYLDISVYDYRFEKLSKEEQENVKDNFKNIEKMLLEKYGENASFELRFPDVYEAEYIGGKKVE